ncbi:hypothetical protein QZH41_003662 [Actinostola sp. cb2023]|nr:hypothetical protein QZH41_003662 [Actinostola sp. cb2023]
MAENTGNNTTIPQCPASPFTAHSYFPNYATKASSIATAALNGVSMPFTILLNAFMMIIIVKNPSLRQKERVMAVLYLSVTDLFTGLISQPLFIAKEISHLNNTERDCAVEEAFYFIFPIFVNASLFHLVVVAYDRHVAINQPYQYFTRITVRRLTYTSIVFWTLAIVKIFIFKLKTLVGLVDLGQEHDFMTALEKVPTNGLVVYCGTIVTDDGKEKKVNIDFEPFKPINTSLYLCDNKFHTETQMFEKQSQTCKDWGEFSSHPRDSKNSSLLSLEGKEGLFTVYIMK